MRLRSSVARLSKVAPGRHQCGCRGSAAVYTGGPGKSVPGPPGLDSGGTGNYTLRFSAAGPALRHSTRPDTLPDTKPSATGPAVLLILDGWGHREPADDNAISLAHTPVW